MFKDWDSSFEDDTQKLIRSRFPAAAVKAVKEKAKNPPKAKGKRKAAPKRKKK